MVKYLNIHEVNLRHSMVIAQRQCDLINIKKKAFAIGRLPMNVRMG